MYYNGKKADFFCGRYLNEISKNAKSIYLKVSVFDILISLKNYFKLNIFSDTLIYEIEPVDDLLYITFSNDCMWYECYYDVSLSEVKGYIIEPLTI